MRGVCAALLVLGLATAASAEPLRVPAWVLVGGQAADAVTTLTNLHAGCVEANTWTYGSSMPSVGRVVAVKAAGVGVSLWVMHWLDRHDHPHAARVVGYVGGAIGGGAAVSNALQHCSF